MPEYPNVEISPIFRRWLFEAHTTVRISWSTRRHVCGVGLTRDAALRRAARKAERELEVVRRTEVRSAPASDVEDFHQ